MLDNNKNWYAVYTKPRWEKKVYGLMLREGIEAYCPLNKIHKRWSDRLRLIEEPLFKSYVFVHIDAHQYQEVRATNGVLNFVYWLGKPAIIKPKEIDMVRRFLNDYENVQIEPMNNLKSNDTVLITGGLLMEKEARVLKQSGKILFLELDTLGYRLVVQVDKSKVKKKYTYSMSGQD